jgi:hypothetical protein
MTFTPEQRAKGLAVRMANKAARDAKRNGKIVDVPAIPKSSIIEHDNFTRAIYETGLAAFDWEEAPLSDCITKASEMKREYDRVAQIILRRQNPVRNQWTCWTQEQKHNPEVQIPRSVLQQCLKRGDDGRWKFRDDGRFVVENGVRVLKSAFCCNSYCYAVYQKYRVRQKVEAGI